MVIQYVNPSLFLYALNANYAICDPTVLNLWISYQGLLQDAAVDDEALRHLWTKNQLEDHFRLYYVTTPYSISAPPPGPPICTTVETRHQWKSTEG